MTHRDITSPAADLHDRVSTTGGTGGARLTRLEDPVRVVLPTALAAALARACTTQMDEHRWTAANVAAARRVLTGGSAQVLLEALARRLGRARPSSPGWAVLALPARLADEELQVAAVAPRRDGRRDDEERRRCAEGARGEARHEHSRKRRPPMTGLVRDPRNQRHRVLRVVQAK